nr:MAG TPA: hypothetical protein [Caudoviricetes sp.]
MSLSKYLLFIIDYRLQMSKYLLIKSEAWRSRR